METTPQETLEKNSTKSKHRFTSYTPPEVDGSSSSQCESSNHDKKGC